MQFFAIKYFGLSTVHFYFYVVQMTSLFGWITSLFGIPLRQGRNYRHAAHASDVKAVIF